MGKPIAWYAAACVLALFAGHGTGPLDRDAAASSESRAWSISPNAIASARRYARSRGANVAFAVVDRPGGRPRGLRRYAMFESASVSKAMLMVAVLRRARGRPVTAGENALLRSMITKSDNDAATTVYHQVGAAGLRTVAWAARMQRFGETGFWASARLTAADQARLFYRIDTIVPRRHRAFARKLLASIVPYQRWGIARVAAIRGYRIFFKGGWRPRINHQAALLEKNGHRFSLAILTGQSGARGRDTEAGIAARILP